MKATTQEKSQVDKFREAARELETDQSDEAFDLIVKKVAKPAPSQPSEAPEIDKDKVRRP